MNMEPIFCSHVETDGLPYIAQSAYHVRGYVLAIRDADLYQGISHFSLLSSKLLSWVNINPVGTAGMEQFKM